LISGFFSPSPNQKPQNDKAVNYTTPLNFKKLLEAEFNLEFDETIAIGFIT